MVGHPYRPQCFPCTERSDAPLVDDAMRRPRLLTRPPAQYGGNLGGGLSDYSVFKLRTGTGYQQSLFDPRRRKR